MESKPKKRQVRKVNSGTPELPKSPQSESKVEKSADQLLIDNGTLVENLFHSKEWIEIAFPLLQESIAGVCGRLTNNRYYHGTLTKDWSANTSVFCAGYQKGLMDFQNNLYAYIESKNQALDRRRSESKEKEGKLYNPYLEDESNEQD